MSKIKAKMLCAILAICVTMLSSCNVLNQSPDIIQQTITDFVQDNQSIEDMPIQDIIDVYTTKDCEWLLENTIENTAAVFGVKFKKAQSGALLLNGKTHTAPFISLNEKLVLIVSYNIKPDDLPAGIIIYGRPNKAAPIKGFYYGMDIKKADAENYTVCDGFVNMSKPGSYEKAKLIKVTQDKAEYSFVFVQSGSTYLLNHVKVSLTADLN